MPNTLTRARMEQAIREGGSVLYNGRLLGKIEHLPSEAELAEGDPEAEAQAQANLQARIAEMQTQLDKLQAAQAANEPKPAGGKAKKPAEGEG